MRARRKRVDLDGRAPETGMDCHDERLRDRIAPRTGTCPAGPLSPACSPYFSSGGVTQRHPGSVADTRRIIYSPGAVGEASAIRLSADADGGRALGLRGAKACGVKSPCIGATGDRE